MYYRKRHRKTNTYHTRPINEVPLNDVWESFQEEKSYLDFGITKEAYLFLSDKTKCKQICEKNNYWKDKSNKIGYFALPIFFLSIISFLYSIEHSEFLIVSGLLFITSIVLLILSFVYEHKIINTYENYSYQYEKYEKYIEQYNIKKTQYLTHTKELDEFKNNISSFITSIAEQLKNLQGRTYRTENDWRQMSDREFEIEVGKVYSRLGYETTVTKQSGDGGVDVIAKKDNETIYIQCKHYGNNTHLGAPELQGFWGCCSGNGIKKGIMVCTSTLTKEAKSFANKLKGKLEIVGMGELLELDKSFYHAHPTNAERSFDDSFKTFIFNNHFIDCYHLWLLPDVFYNEEDAKVHMAKLNKWKDYSYVVKDIIVNLTDKIRVYVVLLVRDYLLKEVQEIRLTY